MAASAPMASAFLKVGSVSGPPTFTTSTVAPCFSLNHMARVNPNSSLGLMTNWTPFVSNLVSPSVKLILEVVSGTLLMQTRIFILDFGFVPKIDIKLEKYYACIVNFIARLAGPNRTGHRLFLTVGRIKKGLRIHGF